MVALALVFATSASAAPAWLAATSVTQSSKAGAIPTQIASSPGGATVSISTIFNNGCATPSCVTRVDVVYRAAGGSFQRTTLTSPTSTGGAGEVAMDALGNAVAIWSEFDGSNDIIRAAYKPLGQSWGMPEDLSAAGANAYAPQIAITPSGEAIAAWRHGTGTNFSIQSKIKPAGNASFGSLIGGLPASGHDEANPDVAIAPNGSAVLVWTSDNGTDQILHGAALAAGSPIFTPLADLSASGGDANAPQLAMDETGRATAVWSRHVGARSVVQTAARGVTGDFDAPADVSDPSTYDADRPKVAVDSNNRAVATWYSKTITGTTYAVQAATRASGSAFASPVQVAASGSAPSPPEIAIAPDNTAMVTFQGPTAGGANAVQSKTLRPGQTIWAGAMNLQVTSNPGPSEKAPYGPVPIAFDAQGNAAAIWGESMPNAADHAYTIRAAGFDAVAPTATALSVPSLGTTGQALRMSAAATDRWASPAITWSFGDGAAATGPVVSHAYAAAGAYTVTVRARDAALNTTTMTRTIHITPPSAIDADRDGFTTAQDCNDSDPRINPKAAEIRGNTIDENCDGVAQELLDLTSSVLPTWRVSPTKFHLKSFRLEGLKQSWSVTVSCKGRGCPFRSKKIKNAKVKTGGGFNAIAKIGRRTTFKPKQTVTVKLTAKGYNARFAIFKLKKGKVPSGAAKCQTRGTKELRACR